MYEIIEVGQEVAGETDAAQARKDLENLITNYNRSTLDIGFLLFKIKKNGYYKNYGYNSYIEFLEELDIKKRKSQYLTRIVDVMEQVGLERADFESVGVAKLREITSLEPTDEEGDPAIYDDPDGQSHLISDIIKGLVVKGREMTLEEIKEYVRTIKGFVGDNELVWLNIQVNRQALIETIQPALDLAKKLLGTAKTDSDGVAQDYSDGKALEMISVDYLLNPANEFIGGKA